MDMVGLKLKPSDPDHSSKIVRKMGIKDLLPLLKREYSAIEQTLPMSIFEGMKIAIDFDILIRAHHSIVVQNLLMSGNTFTNTPDPSEIKIDLSHSILNHLRNKYVLNNVQPIIVLSGVAPPEKDLYARQKRAKDREDAIRRLKTFEEHYTSYTEADYDQLSPKIQKEHAAKRYTASEFPRGLTGEIGEDVRNAGFVVLKAKYEAEELCAALCLEDRVQAIYSTDSDNLVRRAPCMITQFIEKEDGLYAHAYCYSENMLKSLRLTYVQFVELCIMLGCDYNNRRPGYGPGAAYPDLLDHGSIENISQAKQLDFSCLNVERCKEIFNLNHRRNSRECTHEDYMTIYDLAFIEEGQ